MLMPGRQGRVSTASTTSNRLRSAPDRLGEIVGEIPPGTYFDVLEGPECADALAWFRVRAETLEGWMAEGSADEYWVQAIVSDAQTVAGPDIELPGFAFALPGGLGNTMRVGHTPYDPETNSPPFSWARLAEYPIRDANSVIYVYPVEDFLYYRPDRKSSLEQIRGAINTLLTKPETQVSLPSMSESFQVGNVILAQAGIFKDGLALHGVALITPTNGSGGPRPYYVFYGYSSDMKNLIFATLEVNLSSGPLVEATANNLVPSLSVLDEIFHLRAAFPTFNAVANWTTYRNDEYGFEFEYPSDYYLTAQGELYSRDDPDLVEQNQNVDRSTARQGIRIGYSLATSQNAILVQELEAETVDSDYRRRDENSLQAVIEVSGIRAKLVIYFDYPYYLYAYFFDNQYNTIYIYLDIVGETLEEARSSALNNTLVQILSTFRFTRISQATPNVEPDLFKKYGFRIDLPESWKNYRMGEGVYGSYSSICFSFERFCVMQIVMYTPEQYDELVTEYPAYAQNFDYENEEYFYRFEYVSGCAQLSEFECQRTNEVPEILKTFRFQ